MLALNNRHAAELSPLDDAGLQDLLRIAIRATAVAPADALLIALDQDAKYESPNFQWWRQRRKRFVYVDRLVVAEPARGRGLARALYADLFAAIGAGTVTLEVNSDPPNPASDALHTALGFAVFGEANLPGRGKSVRFWARELPGR